MKKSVLIFAMAFLCFEIHAQFFKEAFDRQFLVSDPTGDGTSVLSGLTSLSAPTYTLEIGNGQGTYQTLTGPMMQSLIHMYHATGNYAYLHDFVRISHNVQMHRDDEMQGTNRGDAFERFGETCGGVDLDFVPGTTLDRPNAATWSVLFCFNNSKGWYASAVYSGEVLYPMTMFIHLIRVEKPTLAAQSCALTGFSTWGDYADWLHTRVVQTIDAHTDANYAYNTGQHRRDVYKTRYFGLFNNIPHTGFFHGPSSESLVSHNFATAMGRAYAVIHDYTTDANLRADMKSYLIQLRLNWAGYAGMSANGNGLTWTHGQDINNNEDCPEEMSHGAYMVEMALLCNEYGVTDNSNNALYPINIIESLVATFITKAYNEPLNVGPGIDGNNQCDDGICFTNAPCSQFEEKQLRGAGAWMALSASPAVYNSYDDYIDRDIYNVLMDIDLHYAEDIWPEGAAKTGTPPLIYSLAARYYTQNNEMLDPITCNRAPGSGSLWAGADVGDITADGNNEIVAVRNMSNANKIYAYSVNPHPTYSYLDKMTGAGSINPGNLNFADIAVGNLNPNHAGDEIITATNLNGHLLMFEHNGTNIVQKASYTLANQYSDWSGVAVGDFIKGNGKEEFVAVRNLDGSFIMYEYVPGTNTIQNVLSWTGPSNPDWSRIESGDLDGDGYEDDIVCMNNANGDILTYYYDDNSNSMVAGPSYTAAGTTSQWTDVAIGNFCRHDQPNPDIIVRRALDGEMTMFRIENGQFVAKNGSYFTGGQKMEVLGAGNFNLPSAADELVALRNHDGDIFTFNVRSSCPITGGGRKNLKPDQIAKDVKIVPNPNDGKFEITGISKGAEISLFNAMGAPVRFSRAGNRIDVSKLPKGMYICRIVDGDMVTSLSVVVQ